MRLAACPVLLLLLSTPSAFAQSTLALSGCEPPPEVRQALEGLLSQDALTRLPLKDRFALEQPTLNALQAKYPRDYSLAEQQLNLAKQRQIAAHDQAAIDAARQKVDAQRDAWVKNAKDHPDDALALLLAAKGQFGKDTPDAIRLLEAARMKAPGFPWPAHELATLYSRGKFADDAKMRETMTAFYTLCPAWTPDTTYGSSTENFMLRKDLPLMTKTAAALRAQLATALLATPPDPKSLQSYQVLWQREFLTRPPAEHDALREQIRQDLKRLEAAVPSGDAAWRGFLIEGYKLSGATKDELAQMQDAVARDFSHSAAAESKVWEQWNKAHPRPDGQKDLEAWKAYYAADVDQTKAVIRDFPDDAFARSSSLLEIALDDEFISREDGIAALDRYQQMMDTYGPFGTLSFGPADPARFLLDHGWQPERALELLKKTQTYKNGGHSNPQWSDDIADADIRRFSRNLQTEDRANLGLILKAAALANKPEEALKFRDAIEEQPPTDKNALEQYWTNRARLAALDKHPQDAIAYYRLALDTRTHQPEYRHGLLRDNLTAEFHDQWRAQGGSEEAWLAANPSAASPDGKAILAKDAAAAKKPDAQGDWRNAPKNLLSFQLSDFSGKTWGLKDFSGKVVMITTWATWCEWCRLEDQYLEKFYEKEKGRKDLAILSFDLDENPGQVLPFMQQQGYTFPVLAAFSIPDNMTQSLPRTWIIDPNGNWLWEKVGYDESQAYADFEKEMLGRIDKAKASQ
jgi:thiol-disulfide isomerase/thioredoxin